MIIVHSNVIITILLLLTLMGTYPSSLRHTQHPYFEDTSDFHYSDKETEAKKSVICSRLCAKETSGQR